MVSKELHKLVRKEMAKRRSVKHWNKQDVENIIEAKKTGDWSKVHSSKFYKQYSGEYCSMLEVLNKIMN